MYSKNGSNSHTNNNDSNNDNTNNHNGINKIHLELFVFPILSRKRVSFLKKSVVKIFNKFSAH